MLTTIPSGLLIDWIGLPLAGAGVIGFIVRWLRPRERPIRCPGQRRRLRSPRGCGYDLRGQVRTDEATVTCPECGRTFAPGEYVESRAGWRLRRGAILLGILVAAVGWIPTLPWRALAPDLALALGERILGSTMPIGGRDEVLERARENELGRWSAALIADAAIEELGGDAERGNAVRARCILRAFHRDDILGAGFAERLRSALDSDDHQRRQFAAQLLRESVAHPSPRLLEVSLEGLADDGLAAWNGLGNASSCRRYLTIHVREAAPLLQQGMASADGQQSVFCACILLESDLREHHAQARLALIAHLVDNQVEFDAWYARRTLGDHGRPGLADLERFRDSADPQQRTYVRWLIDRIERLASEAPANPLRVAMD